MFNFLLRLYLYRITRWVAIALDVNCSAQTAPFCPLFQLSRKTRKSASTVFNLASSIHTDCLSDRRGRGCHPHSAWKCLPTRQRLQNVYMPSEMISYTVETDRCWGVVWPLGVNRYIQAHNIPGWSWSWSNHPPCISLLIHQGREKGKDEITEKRAPLCHSQSLAVSFEACLSYAPEKSSKQQSTDMYRLPQNTETSRSCASWLDKCL